MKLANIVRTLAVVVAGFYCVACAGMKVMHNTVNHELGSSKVVHVERFDISTVDFTGDQGEHTAEEVQGLLQSGLLRELRHAGFTAHAVDAGGGATSGILVAGHFELVDAGSGTARALVGMGAGQSKMICEVRLFDVAVSSETPAHEMRVAGGSGGRGGLASSGYASDADAQRMAQVITKYLRKHTRR